MKEPDKLRKGMFNNWQQALFFKNNSIISKNKTRKSNIVHTGLGGSV